MKKKYNFGSHRQRGIALPIVMVILVLAALVTIYTTTTSVKEQQVTADQYRSEQAFSVAQTGIDIALERHNHFEAFTVDGCGNTVLPEADVTSDCTDFSGSVKGSFTVMFCDIWDDDDDDANDDTDSDGVTGASLMAQFLTETKKCLYPIDPAIATTDADGFKNDERVGILSVGKPDDDSGRRTISAVSAPGFNIDRGDSVFPPLSARGNSGLTGNITVINRYDNLTVWLGADLDFSSAAVSTFIRPPSATVDWSRDVMIYVPNSTPPGVNIMDDVDGDGTDDISAISASNNLVGGNSDALIGDANLLNLSEDDLFLGVFLTEKSEVEDMAKAAGQYFTDIDELEAEASTGLIWLKASDDVSLKNPIGTLDEPAFLVVEFTDRTDELTITANAVVHGAVFVFGQASLKGGPVIYGALSVTGSVVGAAGGGTIVYDPESVETNPEGLAGLRGIEPGTWKDWGYVN